MEPILELKHINYAYHTLEGETKALTDISFSVSPGEFVSIVGPSGCGKSTLLSIICGLIDAEDGQVKLNGKSLRESSTNIGYMLQHDHLFEWRTIYRNVLLGLEIRHMLSERSRKYAHELLELYGLKQFENAKPSELSGGMRQRAALIRTLATSPEILLLDEAFSALDYQTRLTVTDDVYRILRQEGITTLMVTHDIPESISMGDRVLILTSRPARVREMMEIDFGPTRTPLTCRGDPRFSRYFDHIWKELKDDDSQK